MDQAERPGNPYTRGIASFVSQLRYEDIPEHVRSRMKLLILDTLGCGVYGSLPPHSRILLSAISRMESQSARPIIAMAVRYADEMSWSTHSP